MLPLHSLPMVRLRLFSLPLDYLLHSTELLQLFQLLQLPLTLSHLQLLDVHLGLDVGSLHTQRNCTRASIVR